MNERTEIKKKYVFWQSRRMIGYLLTGMFVLLLAGFSDAATPGLAQMRIVCDNIEKAIEETEYSETKIEIIDAYIEYLQNVNKEVLVMREDMWKVANTFSGTQPVVFEGVRDVIVVAKTIESTAAIISKTNLIFKSTPIAPSLPMSVSTPVFLIRNWSKIFIVFCNGVTKSFEDLATAMQSASIQSMTLGELKDPLYPGLSRQGRHEAYEQIRQARVLAQELGEVSSLLSSEVSKLGKIKQTILEVEKKYSVWVKKVAATVDDQRMDGKYNKSVFDSLRVEIEGVIDFAEGYLGSNTVADYKKAIGKIMTIANSEAEEGAEVMLLLKDAEKELEEAQTILDACEKYAIEVKLYKGFLAERKTEYEEAMKAIELETPPLMEEDAYPPRALEEALDKHELYKARSTVELVEHTYGMIKGLLNLATKLVRIAPTEELITLPPGVTYPHDIPLQVKLLNVLGEPLAGKHINFFGSGKLQVNPGAADTNKDGIVSATINVWKEIEENLAGSSVEVYIIASGGRKIELRYIFAKPGKPASIVTVSRPQEVGASGAQLPDPWVVIVKDTDGNTINNIPLTVRFEALNGGNVSPEKTTISVQEGESVSVEEAYFSTRLTLGAKDKENYRFRVGIVEPSGHSFNGEITVQSDETSSYGKKRQLPTSVGFSVRPTSLAVDTLTSDILSCLNKLDFALRAKTDFYLGYPSENQDY